MRSHQHQATMAEAHPAKERPRSRRRCCYDIARQRAQRARREGRRGLLVFLIFILTLFSAPFVWPPVAPLPRSTLRRSQSLHVHANAVMAIGNDPDADVPAPRPRHAGSKRYKSRPTLAKLMSDLRRPVARKEATAELLPRITDPVTRRWVADHIADGEITTLAVRARRGCPEEITFAGWQAEANAPLGTDDLETEANGADRTFRRP